MPRLLLAVLALPLLLGLAGCGKKPNFVDPPQGRENDRFPQRYPNPASDPALGTSPGPTATFP
jgi:predicted small lipoprotein YifL